MSALEVVILTKIVVTVLFWAGPLLLAPPGIVKSFGIPGGTPTVFVRLLGSAYAALAVGYSFGLYDLRSDELPTGVIWMGIVSNGLAPVVIIIFALRGAFRTLGGFRQCLVGLSAVAASLISVLMLVFGVLLIE